jgi:hypothetical protein
MLDAAEHRKLVRVVEMVALRILAPEGAGKDIKYLVEIREKYSDGRERAIRRLPGTKLMPYENVQQVVQRFVADYLDHISDVTLDFNYSTSQVFEEEKQSPSYPGVTTVYKKTIVEGRLQVPAGTSLDRFQNNYEFSHQDPSMTTKYFKWMKQSLCKSQGIQYERPRDWTYSALVPPPVGMKADDLMQFLTSNKVDISQFGQGKAKSLQDFSAELLKGECQLIQDPESGAVVRIVEPVLVRMLNTAKGTMLVQAEHKDEKGAVVQLHRLVGTKRRPDENIFNTAKRILQKYLQLDPNQVTFETKDIQVEENETESQAYPGMRTLYQKRTVTAYFTQP